MKKAIIGLFFLPLLSVSLWAQPNCLAFRYQGDTLKYEACTITEEASELYQFSREFQEVYDRAIQHDPTYAQAYRSKSVAYLKSGDFINWKILMDKAVALDPTEHLGYRGWSHFQFFRDYENAIKDIELLDSLLPYDIGYSKNGKYHLQVARALCYKSLGQREKAIEIIETQLKKEKYSMGLYDYLHLGVLYLELGQLEKAAANFHLQSAENELADNQYYLAHVYEQQGDLEKALACLEKSKSLFHEQLYLFDSYTHSVDKVYLKKIEQALQRVKSNG